MSLINFKNEDERLTFLSDFKSALVFAKKLDEVNVKDIEPLENVLDFYGGNDEKMFEMDDEFEFDMEDTEDLIDASRAVHYERQVDPDSDEAGSTTTYDPKTYNTHMKGNLVRAPSSFSKDDM